MPYVMIESRFYPSFVKKEKKEERENRRIEEREIKRKEMRRNGVNVIIYKVVFVLKWEEVTLIN